MKSSCVSSKRIYIRSSKHVETHIYKIALKYFIRLPDEDQLEENAWQAGLLIIATAVSEECWLTARVLVGGGLREVLLLQNVNARNNRKIS